MKWRNVLLVLSLLGIGVVMGLVISASGPVADTPVAPRTALAQPRQSTPPPAPPQAALAAANALSQAFGWVADRVTPSVVTIKSEQTVRTAFTSPPDFPDFFPHDLFRMPRGREEFKREGLGSGVIVSPDGYILTNNHVVEGADKLTVTLGDDANEVQARVVGTDPYTDIAVIKVDVNNLPAIELGNSDSLRVGNWVLAIGSPFGEQLQHTVTAGIVSALGRNIRLIDPGLQPNYPGFEDFIQTDAAINPGNSGGALVNIEGKLVGINTAISSNTGTNSGVGFAIPINLARTIMQQLIANGRVVRGYLGVGIQPITPEIQNSLSLPDRRGAIVKDVTPNSPASRAGLRHGDVIRSIDGQPVRDVDDLRLRIASTPPGREVRLGIWREGRDQAVRVTLDELPAKFRQPGEQNASPRARESTVSKLGMSVATLTPDMARLRNMEGQSGVLVTDVDRNGQAAERGIQPGDLIQEVNLRPVTTAEEFEQKIAQVKPGDSVLLLVRRGNDTVFVGLRIPR